MGRCGYGCGRYMGRCGCSEDVEGTWEGVDMGVEGTWEGGDVVRMWTLLALQVAVVMATVSIHCSSVCEQRSRADEDEVRGMR